MAQNAPETSSQSNTSAPERDSHYFLDMVVFQVEDRLFKVPRYYFAQKSDVFETMFSVPQPEGDLEGSSENKPLMLPGVGKVDFRRLLEVMYPLETTKTLWGTITQEGWTSVLKLATMWNFKDIRKLAIGELSEKLVEPVEQVLLARAYSVPGWLHAGYNALARRPDALSLEEAERIGYRTAVRLFHVREKIRRNGPVMYPWGNPSSSYSDDGNVTPQPLGDASSTIEREFEAELREVERAYNAPESSDSD